MEKPIIPFRNPNQFFEEFLTNELAAILPKATQTPDGVYPAHNIFALMRIEEFAKHIKFPIPPGRSTVYEFCWIKKGELIRTDALQRYIVSENMLCFYAVGNIKAIESCSLDAEGYYCLFDKDYILQFLKNQNTLDELPFFQAGGNPLIKLSAEDADEVRILLEKMEQEHLNDLVDKQRMIGVMLCQLLLLMKRKSVPFTDKKAHTASELTTHKFLESVKLNALTHKSVNYYADLLNVTANHLNKCVKECTGKPVSAHITDMVILEAKVLLKQTKHNVSEIALQLGFDDFSYFTRIFKKQTGLTPKDYRDKFIHPTTI